ncbi:TPA: guanylate kinase [Candidatus Berkelbacteria bacterium]|uniref:Guanylate kinase n=1 Tax=Berkelbacteria bacterium GW2011_GWE1_39_12 TaxID=1618337 RepID=A0A0G4B344_9BACT|nr:MAG: guanylate kinase, guanylate kinase [Berkelbacteria bacterium GW2011_GWE1_39_12]HBO60091.1 guanylate kinase [Candidatus Berkelbacteria bacterium]
MNKGKLFILSGQSGVGKNTIAKQMLENLDLVKIITCTTRDPRPDEIDGKDYFFLTEEDFADKIGNNYFLEYAKVHNWHYGTPKEQAENLLNDGKNILMVIDVQGGVQIKEKMPEARLIFVKYTDGKLEDQIRNRMKNDSSRKELTEEEILKRIESAKKEASYIQDYDYAVTNPDGQPEKAIEEIGGIISKEINEN